MIIKLFKGISKYELSLQVESIVDMRSEQKDNLLMRGLWENGTDCIINMRIIDIDAISYVQNTYDNSIQIVDNETSVSTWMPISKKIITFPPFLYKLTTWWAPRQSPHWNAYSSAFLTSGGNLTPIRAATYG